MADDLDQLLDSALDDFRKIDLNPARKKDAVQGLGLGLPDLKAKKNVKQRAAAPMSKGSSHASEALEKLTQQTREAVRGLESATASAGTRGAGGVGLEEEDEDGMVEEFVKQFEALAGSQDMESILDTMMQQLLSKDFLHEQMKEIGERYPKWLEEHKDGLTQEEYERYHRQYELIIKLNEAYENEPDNFTKIIDLMQKMQECGQPPNDIVEELAPDLDLSNLGGQLSPLMLDSSSTNCGIM